MSDVAPPVIFNFLPPYTAPFMPTSPRDVYEPLHDSPRYSHDSEDSLRALEVSDGPMRARPLRPRSYSIGGFGFQQDLLPLSTSLSNTETVVEDGEKHLSLLSGIALVVGLQIGSGIFSSPGVIVAETGTIGASLGVWFLSGVLAWTGASSFAELGSAIPLNGGAQAYLAYAYGPLVSYLFTWAAIIALKPGGAAIVSLIFGEYVNRIFWHATSSEASPDSIPDWAIKLTATAAILLVTGLTVGTKRLGSRTAVVFTTIKVACLISVMVIGIVQLLRGKAVESFKQPWFKDSSTSASEYALALYSGLWALDGWDQANYVGGEMKNPEKNIPRTIHLSMALVVALFLVANVSYFVVLDKDLVGLSNTVAMDFGRALWGPIGGTIFALMVAISCFGALNGGFYTTSRLIYAAGREGYIPAVFGRMHSSRKTPLNATLLQAAIAIVYIVLGGGFRSLINFSVIASWAFYFLTVFGLVILRFKEPMLERPYKTWIITPLVFCGVALFLLCMPVLAAPLQAMAVFAFILAGVPVYYLTQKRAEDSPRIFAWLSRLGQRVFRRRPVDDGWVAVSTEGDEGMEMLENRR